MSRPTAAKGRFPYQHRTVAEVDAGFAVPVTSLKQALLASLNLDGLPDTSAGLRAPVSPCLHGSGQ